MYYDVLIYCSSHESHWGFLAVNIFYYRSCENLYQVTAITMIRIRYCRSHAICKNMQRNRRFVWWNHYCHITKLYRKKVSLVCCRWCTLVTIQTATNSWYSFVLWCYLYRNLVNYFGVNRAGTLGSKFNATSASKQLFSDSHVTYTMG